MLALNNAHSKHDTTFTWTPKQDYSENGYLVYPRGGKLRFKGRYETDVRLINKLFHDALDRDNMTLTINTVSQFPFKKDDRIANEEGKVYVVVDTRFEYADGQAKFLKTSSLSKNWWLVVESDE